MRVRAATQQDARSGFARADEVCRGRCSGRLRLQLAVPPEPGHLRLRGDRKTHQTVLQLAQMPAYERQTNDVVITREGRGGRACRTIAAPTGFGVTGSPPEAKSPA